MATNNDIISIKKLINRLYGTYITDNRNELKYMSDITDTTLTTGNAFHAKIQKIFALNVNNIPKITVSTTDNGATFTDFDNFKYILESIISLLTQINLFITKSSNYADKYSKVTQINITSIGIGDETLKSDTSKDIADAIISASNILTIGNIKITIAAKITFATAKTYTKNTLTHQTIGSADLTPANAEKILSNHIYYLLNTSTDSLNIQVNALLAYYKLVQHYFNLYETSEKLLLKTTFPDLNTLTSTICNPLNKIHKDLNDEKTTYTDSLLSDNVQNQPDIDVPSATLAKIKQINNPIKINFSVALSTSNYNYYEDKYIFKYTYIKSSVKSELYFPIIKFIYDATKNITDIYLDDTNISFPSDFVFDYDLNSKIAPITDANIKIIKKDLNYLKKDYNITEKELEKYNNNIEKNKRKFNNTVLKYDINSNKIDILNIQLNIYYCIYGIIIFLLLGLNLYEINNNTKKIISLIIIVIIIISILVNYYIKQKYIEEFKENFFATPLLPPTCDAAVYSNTTSRLKYIQDHIDVFVPATKIYLENLISYLPSLNTISLYTKILTSMNKEKKQFDKINKEYYNKFLNGVENTNMVLNEIINYSSYIYLISFSFLIIALLYLSYLLIPDYIKLFLFIALLLFVIVMWVYIYNIKEIVRSNSYNKYWIKPSDNTLNELKRS